MLVFTIGTQCLDMLSGSIWFPIIQPILDDSSTHIISGCTVRCLKIILIFHVAAMTTDIFPCFSILDLGGWCWQRNYIDPSYCGCRKAVLQLVHATHPPLPRQFIFASLRSSQRKDRGFEWMKKRHYSNRFSSANENTKLFAVVLIKQGNYFNLICIIASYHE